jgi:hypothetical protein
VSFCELNRRAMDAPMLKGVARGAMSSGAGTVIKLPKAAVWGSPSCWLSYLSMLASRKLEAPRQAGGPGGWRGGAILPTLDMSSARLKCSAGLVC